MPPPLSWGCEGGATTRASERVVIHFPPRLPPSLPLQAHPPHLDRLTEAEVTAIDNGEPHLGDNHTNENTTGIAANT